MKKTDYRKTLQQDCRANMCGRKNRLFGRENRPFGRENGHLAVKMGPAGKTHVVF